MTRRLEGLVGLLLCVGALAVTDTALGITTCFNNSPVTAFPGCDSFLNVTNVCGEMDEEERQGCMCNQAFLDSIFQCKNEVRLCLEDSVDDGEIDTVASRWHALCDSVVTFHPTTAPLSSISPPANTAFCEGTALPACDSATIMLKECTRLTLDLFAASSCVCQPLLLSLAYTCEFLGNASCNSATPTLSAVWGYSECSNFAQVINTDLSTPNLTRIAPSTAATATAAPGSTRSSGSQASPTASDGHVEKPGWVLWSTLVAGLLVAVFLL